MSIEASSTVVRSSRGRRRRDDTAVERGRHVAMAGGAERARRVRRPVRVRLGLGERREVDSKVATRPASSAIMQWAFMQMVALAALVAPTAAWVVSSGVARPVAPPCAVVSHEPRCSVLRLQSHDDDDDDDEELTDAEVDTSGKIIERVPAALRGVPSVPMANRSIYIPPLSPLLAASALTRSALSASGRLS